MSYGQHPWQQTAWDWRAAGNFIGGGAGSGLIVFAALSAALGHPAPAAFACGALLVGLGLLCVWLEIGRPLRAINVFLHPRRSWMSREAIVATLLLPAALGAALGVPGLPFVAGVLALAFAYSQARIINAAKGIPAWRAPFLVPLVVATALAEGGGLFLLTAPLHRTASLPLMLLAALPVLARWGAWCAYRTRLETTAARPALVRLDAAGAVLQWAGTVGPLALIGLALALGLAVPALADSAAALGAVGGLGAVAAGVWFKFTLITRAAFNQGFALARLPVRGARR